MDLSTTYLGMKLKNPLIVAASPLTERVEAMKRLEEAGAAALVLHSLFEEQLELENKELEQNVRRHENSFPEATSFFPQPDEFRLDASGYLEHIGRAKKSVNIPVIASLNGSTTGGWVRFAKQIEDAGADALELNIYSIPTNFNLSVESIEKTYLDILRTLKSTIKIPVALKMSPFFTNLASMAEKIDEAGANGIVLFNRFYQPDVDIETLTVEPTLSLSTSQELRLRLRWIAILYGRIKADLAATGGIHEVEDIVKMLMAGANVTMLCSVLLLKGILQLKVLEEGLRKWMMKHDYQSVAQMRGALSQAKCGNPSAYERAQYLKILNTFALLSS